MSNGNVNICGPNTTSKDKSWSHDEYYIGDRDEENRKHGEGENHWSGAESLEWYTGHLTRDTMHGVGDYLWRFKGPDGTDQTYEGYFYANDMHGYGTVSYNDGRVFKGLFNKNHRWGPGVETHITRREDVGVWQGPRLVRLAWKPPGMSVVPDIVASPGGTAFVEPHRRVLVSVVEQIGEVNSAFELLKACGSDPISAEKNWIKLYPRHCTDVKSKLFPREIFDRWFYGNRKQYLKVADSKALNEIKIQKEHSSVENISDSNKLYYSWNNSDLITAMMQHAFTHDSQRDSVGLDLTALLSGPRKRFKSPGHHELDSRSVIMASYIGNVLAVAKLINENNVFPDIRDVQGNSALMYAVCGNQSTVINFLLDAGAEVDSYNDACCTPLAVALMNYAAVYHDLTALNTVAAMLPPLPAVVPAPIEDKPLEWKIFRELSPVVPTGLPTMTSVRLNKTGSAKKIKSMTSIKTLVGSKQAGGEQSEETDPDAPPDRFYLNYIFHDFENASNALLREIGANMTNAYIFEVNDIMKEMNLQEEEAKKVTAAPKKIKSAVLKQTAKPSRDVLWAGSKEEYIGSTSMETFKNERLALIKSTIMQLLSRNADPKKVCCPQPALCLAVVAGSTELVRALADHGADVNVTYPQFHHYSPLEMALSRPLTSDTLELVQTLLQCGANADRRLICEEQSGLQITDNLGPTLLHVVLAKRIESEFEEDIRDALLKALLDFGCNPSTLYGGSSAVEAAILKDPNLLNIFVENVKTDLNSVINEENQTILVKMFSVPFCHTIDVATRLQILTNLLLYGADPFLKCQDGDDCYENLFVFAKIFLEDRVFPVEAAMSKSEAKMKKDKDKNVVDKKKGDDKTGKGSNKGGADNILYYQQMLDLVMECARLLRNRWIEAKLMKQLVSIVDRYKHRAWHLIMLEHKAQKATGLWLTAHRCLEIWDILKSTRKKVYQNKTVLSKLLCLMELYNSDHVLSSKLTAQKHNEIEESVKNLLHEHRTSSGDMENDVPWRRPYVKPELTSEHETKYNVCYECCVPSKMEVQCTSCKQVSFCDMECLKRNVEGVSGHPCTEWLRCKYFPTPSESESDINDSNK